MSMSSVWTAGPKVQNGLSFLLVQALYGGLLEVS